MEFISVRKRRTAASSSRPPEPLAVPPSPPQTEGGKWCGGGACGAAPRAPCGPGWSPEGRAGAGA
eukprot:4518815-Alexandrium_andersonii.AAC.1